MLENTTRKQCSRPGTIQRVPTALQHVYAAFKQTEKIEKLLKIDDLKIVNNER